MLWAWLSRWWHGWRSVTYRSSSRRPSSRGIGAAFACSGPDCGIARSRPRFPSVLLQPLGHLSVSLESSTYGDTFSSRQPDCAPDCALTLSASSHILTATRCPCHRRPRAALSLMEPGERLVLGASGIGLPQAISGCHGVPALSAVTAVCLALHPRWRPPASSKLPAHVKDSENRRQPPGSSRVESGRTLDFETTLIDSSA